MPALGGNDLVPIELKSPHLTAYLRRNAGESCVVIANLSEHHVDVPALALLLPLEAKKAECRLTGANLTADSGVFQVGPCAFHVFTA